MLVEREEPAIELSQAGADLAHSFRQLMVALGQHLNGVEHARIVAALFAKNPAEELRDHRADFCLPARVQQQLVELFLSGSDCARNPHRRRRRERGDLRQDWHRTIRFGPNATRTQGNFRCFGANAFH